jgi:hypothetical protein
LASFYKEGLNGYKKTQNRIWYKKEQSDQIIGRENKIIEKREIGVSTEDYIMEWVEEKFQNKGEVTLQDNKRIHELSEAKEENFSNGLIIFVFFI